MAESIVKTANLSDEFTLDAVGKKIYPKGARVWRKQSDGTSATETTDAIVHAGNARVDGALAVLAAADIAATASNDVDVSGTSVVRFTGGGTVTGFAGAAGEQYLTVINASASQSLTVANDSSASAAGSRIETGIGADSVLAPKAACLLQYDSAAQVWRLVSSSRAGTDGNQTPIGINAKSVNYTLTAGDIGKLVHITSGSPVTVTVPAGLVQGFHCSIVQGGVGAVTVSAGSGMTRFTRLGHTKTAGQWAVATVITLSATSFVMQGDTA